VVLVGNLVSYLRAKSEIESVTPDTAFRFNSKDVYVLIWMVCFGYRSRKKIKRQKLLKKKSYPVN
jgi:hypothetical protein